MTVLAALAMTAGACSSPIEPTPPTELPRLSCPADAAAISNDASPVAVTYVVPTAVGGAAPVSVACSPAPGSPFPPGTTTVTCSATDRLGRQGVCGFQVKVSVPPRLTLTRFMAFGDSLTEGKPSRISALDDFAGSYPGVLQALLVSRYVAQAVSMSRQGLGGERTSDGVTRLNTLLASQRPEVLLLMEGSNDLSTGDPAAIPPAVRNMDQMVVNAMTAGASVFLATIPPQVPGSPSGKGYLIVPTYNGEIRKIAGTRNATLIEIYDALKTDLTAYFGADGLHCTTAGYQKMADTFYAAIQAKLELAAVTPTGRPGAAFPGSILTTPAFSKPR